MGYLWIAIPINDFFNYSNDVMKKYSVSAYAELIGSAPGTRKICVYNENEPDAFIKCFSDSNFYRFYFSCYPFLDIAEAEKRGAFYSPEISPFTIEGNGGVETDKTREQIHLRVILKQPEENIKRFYSALKRKLKSIPGIQRGYGAYKNRYYLPTPQITIPHNSHSRNVEGTWEEHCLNSGMVYKQNPPANS